MLVSYIMYLLIFPKGECLLMNENIAVYEALRAHILQKESQIANETIYMSINEQIQELTKAVRQR